MQVRLRELEMQEQQNEEIDNEQQLNTLISLIKERMYDKRIDEFKQSECVICFEEFQKGVLIKKIPVCHHIFHTKCIDDWFKAKMMDPSHKCPMCNAEITVDIVKDALKKKREERLKNENKVI